jgi:hypothetical protein
MNNISGYGIQLYLIASNTFPAGINLTQFADDSDPFDVPSLQIGDSAMGINGDLIVWNKANPIKVNMAMIPSSDDDINLSILLEANRVGKGKVGARDIILLNAQYPDGTYVQFINGFITDGMPANAVASAGRLKSKPYLFTFENKISL